MQRIAFGGFLLYSETLYPTRLKGVPLHGGLFAVSAELGGCHAVESSKCIGEMFHRGVTQFLRNGRDRRIGAAQETAGCGHAGFFFFRLEGLVIVDLEKTFGLSDA